MGIWENIGRVITAHCCITYLQKIDKWYIKEYIEYNTGNVKCDTSIIPLNHWGRVTHICVGKLTNIGSDNGLSPGRRQAIIWTNAGILLIEPLGANISEFLVAIHTFSFTKMHLKMSSAKWRPFCLGLNVLKENEHQSSITVFIYCATY